MSGKFKRSVYFLVVFLFLIEASQAYENFKVAVYCTARDVQALKDEDYFKRSLKALRQHIQIDKVYLEVHRRSTNDLATMRKVKKLFENEGIATAAGITPTGERTDAHHFAVLCYSDEHQVDMLLKAVKIAAQAFDECILDDFFFTSCKCDKCIEAKDGLSWMDFRLQKLTEISRRVVNTAKKTKPGMKMVIKYPNWYAYYQNTGYNLATQPQIFDGIYTGTETRDAVYTHQNLQPYQSYSIMRYLENTAPGKNGGGWVDPLARRTLDRYSQQLALTLFAGAREITLFHWAALYKPLPSNEFLSEIGSVAGNTFQWVDSFLDQLGNPTGLPVYKPFHSSGESFLTSYLGMLGLSLELTPHFPSKGNAVLLTQSAAFDSQIVSKMKQFLSAGGNIIITSGFLQALPAEEIDEFISASVEGSATINRGTDLRFNQIFSFGREINIPVVQAPTNDCWPEVIGLSKGGNSYPLLTTTTYSAGKIILLTVPNDFSDFYALPAETLTGLKKYMISGKDVRLEAPARISLFTYDNNTFIVHSFLEYREKIRLQFSRPVKVFDVISGKEVSSYFRQNETIVETTVDANRFRVFRYHLE